MAPQPLAYMSQIHLPGLAIAQQLNGAQELGTRLSAFMYPTNRVLHRPAVPCPTRALAHQLSWAPIHNTLSPLPTLDVSLKCDTYIPKELKLNPRIHSHHKQVIRSVTIDIDCHPMEIINAYPPNARKANASL